MIFSEISWLLGLISKQCNFFFFFMYKINFSIAQIPTTQYSHKCKMFIPKLLIIDGKRQLAKEIQTCVELIKASYLLLETELVFGDIIDEIDLIVEREGPSQRRQRRVVPRRRFFPQRSHERRQRRHRFRSHRHLLSCFCSSPVWGTDETDTISKQLCIFS